MSDTPPHCVDYEPDHIADYIHSDRKPDASGRICTDVAHQLSERVPRQK